jgi:hypothetical protein
MWWCALEWWIWVLEEVNPISVAHPFELLAIVVVGVGMEVGEKETPS